MSATFQQQGLFTDDKTIAQRFAEWKATPGGGQVLRRMYEITAGCYRDYQRYGYRASQRWIWEEMRRRIGRIQAYLAKHGKRLEHERGFYLNDHFTAPAVRHMIAEHPEWAEMFELRETGKQRLQKRVVVITERLPA